jgi:hypothetical protein
MLTLKLHCSSLELQNPNIQERNYKIANMARYTGKKTLSNRSVRFPCSMWQLGRGDEQLPDEGRDGSMKSVNLGSLAPTTFSWQEQMWMDVVWTD